MEKLKDIDTFYSQKVIPLAFNESLSYMEQICNLISYIENTLVPAINNNANAIKELQEYVQELKKLLDKLNEKIDNVKEELITLINNVNETLTKAINDLDTKVIEHINVSNQKFNELDTNIELINTNIESINTNIAQNTNDIENLKPKNINNVYIYCNRADNIKTQLFQRTDVLREGIIANNFLYVTSYTNSIIGIKNENLEELLNKETYIIPSLEFSNKTKYNEYILPKSFYAFMCGYVINRTTNEITYVNFVHRKNERNYPESDRIVYTPTTQYTTFDMYLTMYVYLED